MVVILKFLHFFKNLIKFLISFLNFLLFFLYNFFDIIIESEDSLFGFSELFSIPFLNLHNLHVFHLQLLEQFPHLALVF